MRLLSNRDFCRFGGSNYFQAADGVEPYTYSIVSGDGVIDPVNGIYYAPITGPSEPLDKVVVVSATDDSGTSVEAEIALLSMEEIVCKIIQEGMGLLDDQIMIQNQKFQLPNDNRLYCSVLIVDGKPFYNNKKTISDDVGLREEQAIGHRSMLSINLMSSTTEARNRRHELMMCLQSSYSIGVQESYSFQIAKTPLNVTMVNNIDGSKIPFAFNVTVPIQYAEKRISYIEYYDKIETAEVKLVEP